MVADLLPVNRSPASKLTLPTPKRDSSCPSLTIDAILTNTFDTGVELAPMTYRITSIASNLLAQKSSLDNPQFVFNGVVQTGMGQQNRPVIYPSDTGETIPALLSVDWGSGLEITITWDDGDPGWPPGTQLVGFSAPLPGTVYARAKFALTSPVSWKGGGSNYVVLDATASIVDSSVPPYAFLCPPIRWQFELGNTTIPLGVPSLEIYFAPAVDLSSWYVTLDNARRFAARDLAKPFLNTSTPTALDLAAASVKGAYTSPPNYVIYSNYGSTGDFELGDWLFANSHLNPSPASADCFDTATMCCLIFQLNASQCDSIHVSTGIQQIWVGTLGQTGVLFPANLRGYSRSGGGNFGEHGVCVYSTSSFLGVCDATVGPHIGNEAPQQYLTDTFTPQSTPSAPFGEDGWAEPPSASPSAVFAPLFTDGQAFTPYSPPSGASASANPAPAARAGFEAARQAFAGRLSFAPLEAEAARVSVSKLDPGLACPTLAKLGRKFRRTTEGPVWRRYLVYASGAGEAHLKIWELTDSADARDRFLNEGSLGEPNVPYAPEWKLGDACGVRKWNLIQDCLWLHRNIVVRLSVIGDGVDAKEVAERLQQALAGL